MKRSELKEKLEKISDESRRYYRQYPNLHLYLMIWEDYLAHVAANRKASIHPVKERARGEVCDAWNISKDTFYQIKRTLEDLCEDVE